MNNHLFKKYIFRTSVEKWFRPSKNYKKLITDHCLKMIGGYKKSWEKRLLEFQWCLQK